MRINHKNNFIQYFGFEGEYNPETPLFTKTTLYADAVTDPVSGEIYYHDNVYLNGFDYFYAVSTHEQLHRTSVKQGKYLNTKINTNYEEMLVYQKTYKLQGLYPNSQINYIDRIIYYGLNAGVYDQYNYFQYKPHHILYKIPRLW